MNEIKTVEDLSLNAWPSHQMQLYDGWLLRFSYFYTHRTNSVEIIAPSTIELSEKINYCEHIYGKWGTPCIFKISPLTDKILDRTLEQRGYQIAHATEVKLLELSEYKRTPLQVPVHIEKGIPSTWIQSLFRLKGTSSEIHKRIVPTMYAAIPKDTISASIMVDGEIVAIGLGIMDRDYIGLYAIHVDPHYRRKHFADSICRSILQEGIREGARKAYLQVVPDNVSAKNLYSSLGFKDFYTYWFRLKRI